MIKIAIVDDNNYHIGDVRELLEEFMVGFNYCVDEYNDGTGFLVAIAEERYDIVFMDIVLNKLNGIEIGTIINEKHPGTNIIFISAYPEYFKDVYKVKHAYFLTKDFEKERFADAIKKVLNDIENKYINLHTKSSVVRIDLSEVTYLEGYFKHTVIHMVDNSSQEFSIDLRNVENILPKGRFLRTHQGFIVNMDHIAEYSRQSVTLVGGVSIPVSRSCLNSVREKLAFYIGGVL